MRYSIVAGDPNSPDVAALLADSEAHARSLYPPEGIYMLDPRELVESSVRFLVARSVEGVAQGCGAVVLAEDRYAEIKRMYVRPESRGRGVGALILRRLEAEVLGLGVYVIRLETGPLQTEAIRLYRRFGYRDCGPFGAYGPGPFSLFMEKDLVGCREGPVGVPPDRSTGCGASASDLSGEG
jgi:putative acetyltransferase